MSTNDKNLKSDHRKLNNLKSVLSRASFVKDPEIFQAELEVAKAQMQRQANDSSGISGGVSFGSKVPLMYVDPMFDPILLMFPKENVKELNRRLRHYYTYHPIVNSVINLHCMVPGTLVQTENGPVAIETLIPGSTILNSAGYSQKVLQISNHPFKGTLHTVKPYYYPEFSMSDQHHIKICRGEYKVEKKEFKTGKALVKWWAPIKQPLWVMVKDIKSTDFLIVPRYKDNSLGTGNLRIDLAKYIVPGWYEATEKYILNIRTKVKLPRYIDITPELSEVLGWYVSEGCACTTKQGSTRIQFALNRKEMAVAERLVILVKKLFLIDAHIKPTNKENCITVDVYSNLLGRFLSDICGKGARNKKIPDFILKGNLLCGRAFLRSLLLGDGSLTGKDQLGYVTVSEVLASQVILLGGKLNILFSLRHEQSNRTGVYYDWYTLQSNKQAIVDNIPDMKLSYAAKTKLNHPYYFSDADNFYVKIRSIEQSEYDEVLYDIKTEDGSFCLPVIVSNSEFPLSDFELRCEEKEIEEYYNDLKDKLNLLSLMVNLNRDYWLLGNGYLYGNWDTSNAEWINFNQYPPENIEIYRTYVGEGAVYYLKADEELKKIVNSPKEADRAISQLIPAEFLESIRSGQPFLLANERLLHFARKPSAYSLIGEPLLKCILKELLYEDKLRLLQYTFVDRLMSPIKHWQIGSAEKGWIPSPKHFKQLEAQLVQAANDPDMNLITHPYVKANFLSGIQMKENLIPHFDFVQKRIMLGLFANDAMLGGEASPYATQAVSMKVVMHRYLMNRTLLENLVRQKIFLPIAIARGFKKVSSAEASHRIINSSPKYILPRFFYTQRLNLMSSTAEQEMLLRLRDKGEIPMSTISDLFGWDLEQMHASMKNEQGTPSDSAWREGRKDAMKDPKVRNQTLKGKKMDDVDLTEDIIKPGAGRPGIPDAEKAKYEPSIVSPGAGDSSPRAKQQERGVIPKPKDTEATPSPLPIPEEL